MSWVILNWEEVMDKIILYIITIFFLVGAIDYFTGNKFKVGEKFYEGITTMGPMFWAIAGFRA